MRGFDDLAARLRPRLARLYGGRADESLNRILELVETCAEELPVASRNRWSERDVVLITYGDQVRADNEPPLRTLGRFLKSTQLEQLINTVHILPFYPYSSDDGFSVIDYRAVNPELGDWPDVRALGEQAGLMFDLVLNHCSQQSDWFRKYLAGEEPFTRFFVEADPATDLSKVTRPRSLPLLTPFETNRGTRHVWTTFSADQVDLNFAEPQVLIEMLGVLLFYIREGARIIRLDAIAYLWKEVGTSCIHLPQTHEVVRLMRDIVDAAAPHVLLLTETNVPHKENVSYFGDGDEAHMVYQFSLPPLLLDAFLHEDAEPITAWLRGLKPGPPGTTFFNFTASHDGVGVRPLEGLVSAERLASLVDCVQKRGGLVSTRRQSDGTDAPYELNISYVDALGFVGKNDRELHARRFLASQAVMLALPGIPGIYFHSLVGTRNDYAGAQESGHARRINRRKLVFDEVMHAINDADSLQQMIFDGFRQLLAVRIEQSAFHPDASVDVCSTGNSSVFAFVRTSKDGAQQVLVVVNVSAVEQVVDLGALCDARFSHDLLGGKRVPENNSLLLGPFEVQWLVAHARE